MQHVRKVNNTKVRNYSIYLIFVFPCIIIYGFCLLINPIQYIVSSTFSHTYCTRALTPALTSDHFPTHINFSNKDSFFPPPLHFTSLHFLSLHFQMIFTSLYFISLNFLMISNTLYLLVK